MPSTTASELRNVGDVMLEGVLDADRLRLALRCYLPVVEAVGKQPQTTTLTVAQGTTGVGFAELGKVGDAGDPDRSQLRRRCWSDARSADRPATVARPHPHRPLATTRRPSGLSRSEAILATSFELPTPTDSVSPVDACTDFLDPRRDLPHTVGGQVVVLARLEIDVGLVERQRLDQR